MSMKVDASDLVYLEMFNVLENLSRLSDVPQFSTEPIIKLINVAEHSYYVALSAMFIYDALVMCGVDIGSIDKGVLLSKALLHDIEECVVSDIPHEAKMGLKKLEGFKSYQDDVAISILGTKFIDAFTYWRLSKTGIGGEIIVLADRLSLVLYLIRESNLGNLYARSTLANMTKLIRKECDNIQDIQPIASSLISWILKKLDVLPKLEMQ